MEAGSGEELYDRLRVMEVRVPPLRERREDIDLLARYFLARFNQRLGKNLLGITAEALAALRNCPWPGNIRQLENVMERMVLLCERSAIGIDDLPADLLSSEAREADEAAPGNGGATPFKELVKRQTQGVERELIEKALEETGGNVTRAAERLGLSRKGLQLKIKELGVRRGSIVGAYRGHILHIFTLQVMAEELGSISKRWIGWKARASLVLTLRQSRGHRTTF